MKPTALMPPDSLEKILQKADVWRASDISHTNGINSASASTISTGYDELNKYLAGSGWPTNSLTEFLLDTSGIGEIRLLTPALSQLSQDQNRWLLMVAPPYIPYAPALLSMGIDISKVLVVTPKKSTDTLWVLEKALASQSCSAVLAWPQQPLKDMQLRRFQVACKAGHCLGVLFRHSRDAKNPSPAELRIQLQAHAASAFNQHSHLKLKILKRKGGWATETFSLQLNDQLLQTTPEFHELNVNNQPRENNLPLQTLKHSGIKHYVLQ